MNNIFGIGTDIVDISRIKKIFNNNKKFKKRVFSLKEIKYCESKTDKIASYSKRFAAKEAFAKSIGTGFRNNLNFKDISITNNKAGKPSFLINEKLKKIIKKHFKTLSVNFFLSISDEKKYSVAFVILQKNND